MIRPPLDDDLIAALPHARRHHVHRNPWNSSFTWGPELYIQPSSPAEVQTTIRLARKAGRHVTVTGCTHATSMTVSGDWLVNLDRMNRVLTIDQTPAR